jgi:hypothetical protein
MATFFTPFQKFGYDMNKDGKPQTVTNILKRFRINEIVRKNNYIYFLYVIKEWEFPDVVSMKAYGRADLDWVIMLTNLILDPYYEWPLNYDQFTKYLAHKYGSFENATQTIHHYERILQDQTTLSDGAQIPRKAVQIDFDSYSALTDLERRAVTNYDYELELNDKRREIKVLDSQYIPQIENEVEKIFA